MSLAVNDMVVYRAARWQVVRIAPRIQSADYTAPHRPDRLRLFRSATGEAIWADAPDVTPTGEAAP